jgi:Phosphatidylserine/phosphatidylglycerophosphate/cardiolipin synthases and related enzymes
MSHLSLQTIVAAGFILASLLCMGAVVFFERKNPASTIAWVLVLVFLPIVGFVAYLFIGSGFRVNKKKKYRLKAQIDSLFDNSIRQHLNVMEALKFMEAHDSAVRLMTYLYNDGDGIYTADNDGEIFIDGREMFDRMIEDIKAAKDHIHLLYFIFNNDDLGREIAGLLTHMAKKGVEVRLIYDSLGSRAVFRPAIFRDLTRAGGQVLGFSPIFSNLSSHFRLNYRNHRKITVIDGRVGYVGGMNITSDCLNKNKKLCPWRDTHLRLTGSSVWFLQERFLMDWGYTSDMEMDQRLNIPKFFPDCPREGHLGVQIVSSGPDTNRNPLKNGLLTMINSARRSVYLQTPYFSPDDSIMDALRIAGKSRVDVRLMLPALNDHWLSKMSAFGYARDVLECGVRVFLYPGFLHAKTAVSDGLVSTIGTANINNRSYLLDFEINAFIYDADFAARCESIFLADQALCAELSLDWFATKGRLTQAGYNFSRLFAPIM